MRKDILVGEVISVKDALKRLDKTAEKVLIVVDSREALLGTISDGDIRRFILKGGNLQKDIRGVYNRKPTYVYLENFSTEAVKNIFVKNKFGLIPVLDKQNRVADFITWDQAFSDEEKSAIDTTDLKIPVVIMAGGRSTRLEPFTRIFPKPLIPIGDKPIVEVIIDTFRKQGVRKYFLILNYKGEMIESYFNNIAKDYQIIYIKETDYHGTAGGLRLIEKEIEDVFIVSNCDVIVKTRFNEVVNFHNEHKAILTVLSSVQHYKIPYGVVRFEEGGKVVDITEKPEYSFVVNAGVYVLSKEALQFVPQDSPFDMTDLIKILIENKKNIFTYPVNENDYIDIGQWEEYKKAIEKLPISQ